MINKLQNGIEKEEFILFYQPEYNLITNEIIGVEALVRWPHPENGFIPPDIFIPIAERSKQIYTLERWIVNEALQQKQEWEENGLENIELSINLSSKTLESESNFQKIEEIICSYQVDFTKIIFEITETIILTQVDLAIERLNRLRAYGIKIALDDFGTGYSSFTHIRKLPIDIIKIDKSFIQSIPHGNEETIITHNILTLAHELNYRVVAEGIETQEQLDYLRSSSCERGQGYLLCKPLPGDKINEVLLR
jgi:EAL domain-containing protein (putative c-di-GMP-specific phosphodiesterase class I)